MQGGHGRVNTRMGYSWVIQWVIPNWLATRVLNAAYNVLNVNKCPILVQVTSVLLCKIKHALLSHHK